MFIEYFKHQHDETKPLTTEDIKFLKDGRIQANLPYQDLETVQPGDRFMYALVRQSREPNLEEVDNGFTAILNISILKFVFRGNDCVNFDPTTLRFTGLHNNLPRFDVVAADE